MKIVLDSNVLISAFATRGLCADLFRDVIAEHELQVSQHIVNEVTEKLKAKLKIPGATVRDIGKLLERFLVADPIMTDGDYGILDPDDVPIVAFAEAVSADLLITGDRDLLDIARSLPVRVVSPREFYGN